MRKRSEEDLRKPQNRFKLREMKERIIPDGVGIEVNEKLMTRHLIKDFCISVVGLQEYLKNVVKILNELTPLTFEKTLPKIKALNLNTEERLSRVSQLLYEKVWGFN